MLFLNLSSTVCLAVRQGSESPLASAHGNVLPICSLGCRCQGVWFRWQQSVVGHCGHGSWLWTLQLYHDYETQRPDHWTHSKLFWKDRGWIVFSVSSGLAVFIEIEIVLVVFVGGSHCRSFLYSELALWLRHRVESRLMACILREQMLQKHG